MIHLIIFSQCLDVERTVCGTHVSNSNQEHIYQRPDSQTAKTEEFAQPLPPLSQVEPVCTKATERDAERRHEKGLETARSYWFLQQSE